MIKKKTRMIINKFYYFILYQQVYLWNLNILNLTENENFLYWYEYL